jgi:hypothetical protein
VFLSSKRLLRGVTEEVDLFAVGLKRLNNQEEHGTIPNHEYVQKMT